MNLFRLMCASWVLIVYIAIGVNCRWPPTEISNRENDEVESGKSVVDAKRRRSSELQLEKSIVSHDQGETRKQRTQKGRKRQRQRRPHKTQRKKKRQLDNRIRAHHFDAFEADYVDFGALIGQNGAFSWHANYSPD
ncbi:uncharacterized protein LOC129566658 [Sitodiplosis mosellana]|uniref:uncharacterized protein LOC129566658 n=1 Tax=Sitodiplosis mosellana TaxID=263140 RepID=UPI002444F187|nr:uncharacterized protein LOC129566658 [Sitodiplosis mosellana]